MDQSLICAHVSDLPSNHQALKSIKGKNKTFSLSVQNSSNEYHDDVTMVMEQGHPACACDVWDVVLCSLPLGKADLTQCSIGGKFAPSCGSLPTNSGSVSGVLRGGRVSVKR